MDEVKSEIIYRMSESCELDIPQPFCLIIFGASGDLTRRKVLPALYRLSRKNHLPDHFLILGAARTELDDEDFRTTMQDAVKKAFPEEFSDSHWDSFSKKLYYTSIDYTKADTYQSLIRKLQSIEQQYRTDENRIFYLAVPPLMYEPILSNLGEAGLSDKNAGYRHIVIEKPFGRDLESARKLNASLARYFEEKQIYRMDHYLAKENVQNILMFRFANSMFEPIWNRRYIDHVQITVSETVGIEHRAGYYEEAGVLRDMFQNHLFQLLALTAMEPPAAFDAERVRDEKTKVFRSITPFPSNRLEEFIVLGQYGKGTVDGKEVVAYREEPDVATDSTTPTFAALKVSVDNWRWNGVPFYLRSGKRLSKRKAEVSIHFKPVPHMMFSSTMEESIGPDILVLRVQPDEGISMLIQTKNPGSRVCLNTTLMDFSYQNVFLLDAYERILLDCMQGDQMLFVRADGVEQTWALLTPLIERLEETTKPDAFPNYASGSSGPDAAALLIERDGRKWRNLE